MSLSVIYSDVDGTLVGPRGSFFRSEDRSLTLAPAHALVEAQEAGVALVLVSGRSRVQLTETALLLGADAFIGELGAIVGWDGGRAVHRMPGAELAPPPELVDALLEHYRGSLELHDPWHVGHEVDVLLRGQVDPEAVHAWLARAGHPSLRLQDNGILPHRDRPVHVYHLLPDGVSKGRAVAFDLARRGVPAAQAAAVGDSLSDLEMAREVGRFFLVANGLRHPGVAAAVSEGIPGLQVTAQSLGLGWAEAVRAALAAPH